jgi:hypothetical protein
MSGMPPEKVTKVLVLDLENTEPPRATRHTAEAGTEFLVKWYPLEKAPDGFQPVAGGVIFIPQEVEVSREDAVVIQATPRSCRYRDEFDMLVLILPPGTTLSWRQPPRAAKEFKGRLTFYWLSADHSRAERVAEVVWKHSPADKPALELAESINGFLEDERGDVPVFSIDDYAHYDVALSYASEDRVFAATMAEALTRAGLHVFFDDRESARLLGRQLGPELHAIYSKRSTFCVILVSQHYVAKRWTREELRAAIQGMAVTRRRDAIIPVRLDSTVLDELPEDIVYVPIGSGIESVCAAVIEKVRGNPRGGDAHGKKT